MIIKTILTVIGFILAVIGLCELIHATRLTFLSPKIKKKSISVIWLKPDSAMEQIGFAAEQLCWQGNDYADYTLAVTDLLTEEELDGCRPTANGRNIIFCKASNLEGLLCRLLNNED